MNTVKIFNDIPLAIDTGELIGRLRVREDSSMAGDVENMAREAVALGRPRALVRTASIGSRGGSGFTLEGIPFTSSILQKILSGADLALAHLATAGIELDDWAAGFNDMFLNFCAEEIKSMALEQAASRLQQFASEQYPDVNSFANPGSTVDWPLEEMERLFELLGDPEEAVSVSLTENFMMVPVKSIAGIAFHSERPFFNCLLCRQENCPGRRADFDPALHGLHCSEH